MAWMLAPVRRALALCVSTSLLGLAACGGGGGAGSAAPAAQSPSAADAVGASPAAPIAGPSTPVASTPPATAAPFSYRMEVVVKAPEGGLYGIARRSGDQPLPEVWPQSVAADGRFVGTYLVRPAMPQGNEGSEHVFAYEPGGKLFIVGDPAKELSSFPVGINDHGVAALEVVELNGETQTYSWSAAGGLRPLPAIANSSGGSPVGITDGGVIGGVYCFSTPPFQCNDFRWSTTDGSVTTVPKFNPLSINQSGTMVGYVQDDDGSSHFATSSPDGTITRLQPDVPLTGAPMPRIADDGQITFSLYVPLGDLKPGIVVLRDGKVFNFGYGIAPNAVEGREFVSGDSDDRSGLVIGRDVPDRDSTATPLAGFFWSPATGTRRVEVNGQPAGPARVNKQGVVVGATTGGLFVWNASTGGWLLDPLVTNLPAGVHLARAEAIGDGGHIVARTDAGDLVLLIPNAGCFPSS